MKMNKCIACGLDFSSVKAFDTHRIFKDAKRSWLSRGCMTPSEMTNRGMEFRNGKWGFPLSESERKRLSALKGSENSRFSGEDDESRHPDKNKP